MRGSRHHGMLLLFWLLSLGLIACQRDEPLVSSGQPLIVEGRTVLRKGNGAEPQTLDPQRAEDVSSANILRDLYEGLVLMGPGARPIPGVATHWEESPDHLTWTFTLREQARWSNGDPLTAEDFVAGMRRSVDPKVGSNYGMILAPILHAEEVIAGKQPPQALGVEAVDAHTLRIRLKSPTPYLLGMLTHSTSLPIHRPSLAKYGERFTQPGHLISNGAYQLVEWVPQSHITLRRNPYYWNDGHTRIDEVRYYAIEDSAVEFARYRAGELDWAGVPTSQFRRVRKYLGQELHVDPYFATYYYGFNLTRPPFKDALKLRQALSMAIDRDIITQYVLGGGELPAYGWVPPGIAGYTGAELPYAHWTREQRLAQARKLYREAGYSPEHPLSVEIRYNTSDENRKLSLAIAQMWKQALGVQVSLFNEEWKVFLQNRKQKRMTEAFTAGWVGDYPDPYTFLELMRSDYGINDTGYHSQTYDALLDQVTRLPAGAERNRLMQRAEAQMLADQPVMPVFYYVGKRLLKPWVQGYQPNIMNQHYTKDLAIRRPAG